MADYQDVFSLIDPLLDVVSEASAAIMDIYRNEDFGVQIKVDDSPVTTADLRANDIICKGLNKLSFQYPIISEENMEIPYGTRSAYNRYWLIDPLDGTKEFIKRNGEFTINIALMEGEHPILGIVAAPALQEYYFGVKGCGSYLERNNITCRLECGTYHPLQKDMIIPCSLSHINTDTKNYIRQYENATLVPRGSALKFMMIANAEAHLYPRLAPTMEWDTAAPQIIVEEAGGVVINYETKTPLTYNKYSLVNPAFVVFSKLDTTY
jgi:3'(2'), 5'-bisphosphate nucleotidase